MPLKIKNHEEFLTFVKKAEENEKLLKQYMQVNKGLLLKCKELKAKVSWNDYFIEKIHDSLIVHSEEGENWFSILENNINSYLTKIESKKEIIHPKYFLTGILYPALSNHGRDGLIVYQNVVKDIQHFLLQPYAIESNILNFTPKETTTKKDEDNYFDVEAFVKSEKFRKIA